jgi:muramoyltetrapeptide carboxypeptidase
VIRRHPKVFVGFSDITILHIAIQQRAGLITFHGPNLQDGFGKPEDMPAANEAALWQAVGDTRIYKAPSPCPLPVREGDIAAPSPDRLSMPEGYAFDLQGVEGAELRPINGGVATGRLVGGNLAVLCGLMGTPFEIETAGRILFIEDVSERLYRIDRYLAQLTMADKLSSVAGVLVGTFSYDEGDTAESESDVLALLTDYLGRSNVPVLTGFPAGHAQYNLALPMGALVELDADRRIVTVCERPTV